MMRARIGAGLMSLLMTTISLPAVAGAISSEPATTSFVRTISAVDWQLKNGAYRAVIELDQTIPNADAIVTFELNGRRHVRMIEAMQKKPPANLALAANRENWEKVKTGEAVRHFLWEWAPFLRGFRADELEGTELRIESFSYVARVEAVTEVDEWAVLEMSRGFPSNPYYDLIGTCRGKVIRVSSEGALEGYRVARGARNVYLFPSIAELKKQGCDSPADLVGSAMSIFATGTDFFTLNEWYTLQLK